jgi:hypothetical protein
VNLAIREHRLTPLVTVTAAALVFVILVIAVRLQWAPLESADHGAEASINGLIAGNATLMSVVKATTFLGSNGVLWTVIAAATVILAIRRRWRLAATCSSRARARWSAILDLAVPRAGLASRFAAVPRRRHD